MNRPFFSICIAAYNADNYIEECLASIAMQDCDDYEVVIVDDGSTIPLALSKNVVCSIPACSVKRIANGGPYAARQMAFDMARGEVILCVDADDKLFGVSVLAELKRVFIEHGPDIVLFNASSSECNPSSMFNLSSLGRGGAVCESLVWRLYSKDFALNSLCCKAFKKTLYIKEEKFRPRLLMAEDRLQSLEIMRNAHTYWLIDKPLYFYRPNPASTTNANYDPAYYHQACYVEEEVIAHLIELGMALDDWARYFLEYTSHALLGIRYNRGLGKVERRNAYESSRGEHAFGLAMGHCPIASLSKVDMLRLLLLQEGRFSMLDASMLPWRIGSEVKRFLLPFCGHVGTGGAIHD